MSLLDAIVACYNKNCFEPLRSVLAEDCVYRSQWVFDEMRGKNRIVDYLNDKAKTIRTAKAFVTAKKAMITSPYENRCCAALFQSSISNSEASCLVLIEESQGAIVSIDICIPELFEYEVEQD